MSLDAAVHAATECFEPALRNELRIELGTLVARHSEGSAYLLTGSLVEGLGNSCSDIDVYAFVPSTEERPAVASAIGLRQFRYIDVEYLDVPSLDTLASRVDQAIATRTRLSNRDVDRYYRILIAIHCNVEIELASALRRFSMQTARRATAQYFSSAARESAARAITCSQVGAMHEAAFATREAVLESMTADLAGIGEAYPSTKWVFEKTARHWGFESAEVSALLDQYNLAAADPIPLALAIFNACSATAAKDTIPKYSLADGTAYLDLGGRRYVTRRRKEIIRVDDRPVLDTLCRRLADGESFEHALSVVAEMHGIPADGAWLAARRDLEALSKAGFLESADGA